MTPYWSTKLKASYKIVFIPLPFNITLGNFLYFSIEMSMILKLPLSGLQFDKYFKICKPFSSHGQTLIFEYGHYSSHKNVTECCTVVWMFLMYFQVTKTCVSRAQPCFYEEWWIHVWTCQFWQWPCTLEYKVSKSYTKHTFKTRCESICVRWTS